MKLFIHNILISESDEIKADVELSIGDNNSKALNLIGLHVKDLAIALSGILNSFSRNENYNKYMLRGTNQCTVNTSNSDVFNTLQLEFIFENGKRVSSIEWSGTLAEVGFDLYTKIISAFISNGRLDLCEPWASNTRELPKGSPFNIGDLVQTKIGNNVKTIRKGHIFSRTFHYKRQTHQYYLLIDGKRYKKQYYQMDLEKINA